MSRTTIWTIALCLGATAMAVSSCGGSDSPTSPTNPGGGSPAATITIGADGRVAPGTVTVAVGSQVRFTNNHTRAHDMNSDPHPEHTQCPDINVGNLQPGQSRDTQNLTTARTCGFHDHGEPTNTGLQGSIRIQ